MSVYHGGSAPFPEQTPEFLVKTSNSGICFSGGGTRSLSACMGQMRALHKLDILENARYISCVSGGSWASAAYTYYQSGPKDDDALLGEDPTLEEMQSWTCEHWKNSLKKPSLGYPATADFAQSLTQYLERSPHDLAWIDAVRDTYFKPYGLDQLCYFSDHDEVVHEIISENADVQPDWQASDFNQPRKNRPYLIINATLLWPIEALDKVNRVLIQFTPQYVGHACLQYLEEKNVFEKTTTQVIGGGFLDTFAFQSSGPNAISDDWLEMPIPEQPFSLWHASGISSSAYGYDAAEIDFKTMIPQVDYWAVSEVESSQSVVAPHYISDGGNLENLGIMALLQRQVETIVVFENTPVPIHKNKSGHITVDTVVTSLFGVDNDDFPRNQVFNADELAPLLETLWQARMSGNLCMAQTQHITLQNDWFGIKPYSVKILWVYNSPVDLWATQLSQSVQEDISQGVQGKGALAHFPNYKTLDEDDFLSIRLTAYQVSMISNMFSWSIQKNADIFREFLPAAIK